MVQKPFSDSIVFIQSQTGKTTIGPLRIAVFDPEKNPIVVMEDKTTENNEVAIRRHIKKIAEFVVNNLYRGAFKKPSKIIWVENDKNGVSRCSMKAVEENPQLNPCPFGKVFFARPVWSPEKDPDIINVVKKLGDLGENGSVPPYEPGYR